MIVFIDETSFETPPSKFISLLVIVSRKYDINKLLLLDQAILKIFQDNISSLFVVYLLRIGQTSELRSFAC